MRITIFATVCLVLGAVIGSTLARQEFARERLPTDGATATVGDPSGSAEIRGPRLTLLSPESFDFGMMDQNSTMTHVFKIKNDGDKPMRVHLSGTSCKCTAAGLAKELLAPQETAEITLEWSGKGHADIFEQYADYETTDLRRPKFRLTVKGHVRSTLNAEPREAIFNRVSSQEPARATVRILSLGTDELKIISHKFTHAKSAPHFSVEFQPVDPASLPPKSDYKSAVDMHVDLQPGLPLGQLAQTIQITTNRNPDATFDIPVYGSIVSDISLIGPHVSAETMTVDLGSIASRQGTKSVVYVIVKGPHRDETQLKVAEVKPAAELTATLGEPIRNNPQIVSFPVTLQVAAGTTPVSRISSGSRIAVRIETTHPQVKEVTFFVKYAVVD